MLNTDDPAVFRGTRCWRPPPARASRRARPGPGHMVRCMTRLCAAAIDTHTRYFNVYMVKSIDRRSERQGCEKMQPDVDAINGCEPEIKALSDEQLRGRSAELRARFAELTAAPRAALDERYADQNRHNSTVEKEYQKSLREVQNGALDDLLPEAFAVVPRGRPPRHRPAPLRRAADRRHVPAPGLHRRDAHRRRQDPHRHPAALPQRAVRQAACTSSRSNDYLARRRRWMGRSTTSWA